MKRHWKSQSDEDRRTRILSAAQEVFSLHGFRDAEVKQIAERAGVGKATIYKFFESKEALLLVVVEENLARMRDLALSSLVGSSGDPLDRLENASRALARYISVNQELVRVLIQEAGEFAGDIQRSYLDTIDQNLPIAEAFFESFRKEGHFVNVDTRTIVMTMVSLMIGAVYTWALTDNKTNLEDCAIAYFNLLVSGIAPNRKVWATSKF